MVEMVPEAESQKIFRKLARKHDIVFATSFGYMDGMVKAAAKAPDTIFMHATGYKGNKSKYGQLRLSLISSTIPHRDCSRNVDKNK